MAVVAQIAHQIGTELGRIEIYGQMPYLCECIGIVRLIEPHN